jgi:hypothetical protein
MTAVDSRAHLSSSRGKGHAAARAASARSAFRTSGSSSKLTSALAHRGAYQGSTEELTPLSHDWRSATPGLIATAATLARPITSQWFSGGAVENYALTPAGWDQILAAAGQAPLHA